MRLAVASLGFAAALAACGGSSTEPSGPRALSSIAVAPATLSISLGETRQLDAFGTYTDGSGQQLRTGLSWTSSNHGVATVTASGLVTAIAAGSATIAASHSESGKYGRATVTVRAGGSVTATVIPYGSGVSRAESVGIGTRYYKVTGVEASFPYAISLDGMSGDVDLIVYSDAAFQQVQCESLTAGTVEERCVTAGSASGEIYLAVDGQYSGSGATFTLNVTDAFPVTQLVHPGDFPHSGSVGTGTNRYRVTGLVPTALYAVRLAGLTADADLVVYSDAAFQQPQCAPQIGNLESEQCIVAPNASGAIYLAVDGRYSGGGADFELYVTIVTQLGYPGGLPHHGEVGVVDEYYRVTGLTPGTYVIVTLTDLTADVDLAIYADSLFEQPRCASELGDTQPEQCVFTASAPGELYVGVRLYLGSSASFTLDVAQVTPLAYQTADLPHAGSVPAGGERNYAVTGLTPDVPFTVSMTSLSDDVDLVVCSDPACQLLICSPRLGGLASEQCTVTPNARGELYVMADGWYSASTATFSLDVQP